MATAPSPAPAPAPSPEPVAPPPAQDGLQPPAELVADEEPARPVLSVRILRDGPMGEFGSERDDLPADWLSEAISRGDVEVISA